MDWTIRLMKQESSQNVFAVTRGKYVVFIFTRWVLLILKGQFLPGPRVPAGDMCNQGQCEPGTLKCQGAIRAAPDPNPKQVAPDN